VTTPLTMLVVGTYLASSGSRRIRPTRSRRALDNPAAVADPDAGADGDGDAQAWQVMLP